MFEEFIGVFIIVGIVLFGIVVIVIKQKMLSLGIVPNEYKEFPVFKGKVISYRKANTKKYQRLTMVFKNANPREVEEYKVKVQSMGYFVATDVRYDKDNTYIIIEPQKNNLKVAFHIKR